MEKRYLSILVIVLATVVGAFLYFWITDELTQMFADRIDTRDNSHMSKFRTQPECVADCEKGGWQKMSATCNQTVDSASDLKMCLMRFRWSSVNAETNITEFSDGFIDIGGTRIWNSFSVKSIRVHIYRQWAADEDGNLYLLGESG